jgi:predicted DNA-binding transcriptional regulator AlpA
MKSTSKILAGDAPAYHHIDKRAHQIAAAPATSGDADELLSTMQLAALLGVSTQWLEIGRSRGYGPPFKTLGPRMIRYRRGDVRAWLESRSRHRTMKPSDRRGRMP